MITDLGLSVGFVAALYAAWRWSNPRAAVWLFAGAASYALSAVYWRVGGPHPETVAGVSDFAICIGIYFFGRYAWEMILWRIFQAMLLVNIIFLGGNLGLFPVSITGYSVILEALNWSAILLLGGTSALQGVGSYDGIVERAWRPVRGALRFVRAQRSHPPFTARKA